MSTLPTPCSRCGRAVELRADALWETCAACWAWERATSGASNTLREGLRVSGDTMSVDFWYPRQEGPKYLQLGLYDVRAADDLKIHYDFERDGWAVEQSWTEVVDMGAYDDHVEHWQEVGFFPAWALEREKGIMQQKDDDA